MAFTLDREEAARRLGVSSRTIDRHIQAERIRTRRIGKKMFLEEDDVESIRLADPARKSEDYVVITEKKITPELSTEKSTALAQKNHSAALTELVRLYEDSQAIIAKKDSTIQELSYKLGKAETELANSIPALEYKKATFMLESAKSKSDTDVQVMNSKISILESEVNKRNSALVALAILFVLVLAFAVIFVLFWNTLLK